MNQKHPADFFEQFSPGKTVRERFDVILSNLDRQSDVYVHDYGHGRNIYVKCGEPSKTAPIFEAHYDVVDIHSDNCLDNTASVCHLLALASDPSFIGYLSFTDGEELVDFDMSGARYLAKTMIYGDFFGLHPVIRPVVCLELTAVGDVIWADIVGNDGNSDVSDDANDANDAEYYALLDQLKIKECRLCPFNDAVILRHFFIKAVQVSITPSDQFLERYPLNWRRCHQMSDSFSLANRDDMSKFQQWMKSVANP